MTATAEATAPPRRKPVRLRFRSQFNPAQRRAWGSTARWTAFLGGWGAGKTWLGARAFLRNVVENPRGVDSLLVAPFWSTVRKTTLREFLAVTPKALITDRSRQDRYVEVLGRRVYYGSADDPETLDGSTVGAVWIDEGRYVSEDGWRVILTRLRSKRARALRGFISSTPGGAWLEEEFGTDKANRVVVHGSTRENAHHLGAGTVEDMESSLSARAAKIYIEGQFGLLEGAVYDFDKGRHLIPWKYDPRLPVTVAWDFGFQRPAVLFLQPIPTGTILPPVKGLRVGRTALPGSWVVFDELVPDGTTTEQLALLVRAKGYRIATIYCDPAGDGTQTATGLSDVGVVRAAGLPHPKFLTEPRLRHIPFGVRTLEALLGNVRGETRLFVAQQLDQAKSRRGTVKSLLGYHYPEIKSGRRIDDKPYKDELFDHACDALRYFAVNEAVRAGTIRDGVAGQQVR